MFGLGRDPDDDASDLRWELDTHSGRIPLGTLPIADDGDNLFLVHLSGDLTGVISFWNRDDEVALPVERMLPRVASSFSAFMEKCQVAEDEGMTTTNDPFAAIERFDVRRLRELLNAGLDPNSVGSQGTTLLCKAAGSNPEAVSLLLDRGADPDLVSPRTGYSPLYLAVCAGATDAIQYLLVKGASRFMPADSNTRILDIVYPRVRGRVARLFKME